MQDVLEHLKARIRRFEHRLFVRLRKITLPGFGGVGLYDVLRFFLYGLGDAKFSLMAAAMAYNFFFSLFPTVILILIIIALSPLPGLEDTIMGFFDRILLPEGMELIESIVVQVLHPNKGEAIGIISLTAFLALRGATRGVIAMTRAFTKDQEVFKRRNLFQTYGTSLAILFVLGGLFLFSIGALATGEFLIHYLKSEGFLTEGIQTFLLKTLNYSISMLMLIFSISTIYYLAPATHQRWKFFSLGSAAASFLTLLTIIGFSWFFSHFGTFNKIYGSLATIILLMLWFYYISIVLLIGFELNAAIDIAQYHRDKKLEFRNKEIDDAIEGDRSLSISLIEEINEEEDDTPLKKTAEPERREKKEDEGPRNQ